MTYDPEKKEEKSVFGVIVHSFFVVPFLIAVFFILLFTGVKILTAEKQTIYDYLNDVKNGGASKRWQSAFKLAQYLSQKASVAGDERFDAELIHAFHQSKNDDDRVRQYLALAMARTGKEKFVDPLLSALKDEKEENVCALIYALGSLKAKRAVPLISTFLSHSSAKIRSGAAAALGTIGDPQAISFLKKALNDSEPNVQWGSSISLAMMHDGSGREILLNLLNRQYLSKFPELDPEEQNDLIVLAIEGASQLNDPRLQEAVQKLAQSDPNMNVRKLAMEKIKGRDALQCVSTNRDSYEFR